MATNEKEIELYRNLMPVPDHFEEGFGGKTVVGAIFLGFIMVPASLYLSLFMGAGLGPAAQWVTVILFSEMVKRSMKSLRQQEIFVLFYMTGMVLSGGVGQSLLWSQYLVQSPAAVSMGVAPDIPSWVAPSKAVLSHYGRTFFTPYWPADALYVRRAADQPHRQLRPGLRDLPHHRSRREAPVPHGAGRRPGHHRPRRRPQQPAALEATLLHARRRPRPGVGHHLRRRPRDHRRDLQRAGSDHPHPLARPDPRPQQGNIPPRDAAEHRLRPHSRDGGHGPAVLGRHGQLPRLPLDARAQPDALSQRPAAELARRRRRDQHDLQEPARLLSLLRHRADAGDLPRERGAADQAADDDRWGDSIRRPATTATV